MRSAVLVLALLGLSALVQAAEVEVEEGVLVITADNYQQIIDENEFVLVEFCKCLCKDNYVLDRRYIILLSKS